MPYLPLLEAHTRFPALSVSRLRQLCQSARVPARKLHDRLWEIDPEALKKYLASDRKPGPKPLPQQKD